MAPQPIFGRLGLGVAIIFAILILYANVNFFYSGDTAFVEKLLLVYIIIFLMSFFILRLEFPAILNNFRSIMYFVAAFFGSSIFFISLPSIPATFVGSVASVVQGISSVYFVQSLLAGFIETLVFIYAIHKKIMNPKTAFIVSNLLFVVFHTALIYGQAAEAGIPIWIPVIALTILNSGFQLAYIYGKKDKGIGFELSFAIHFAWDLKVFGILVLLFQGIVVPGVVG